MRSRTPPQHHDSLPKTLEKMAELERSVAEVEAKAGVTRPLRACGCSDRSIHACIHAVTNPITPGSGCPCWCHKAPGLSG